MLLESVRGGDEEEEALTAKTIEDYMMHGPLGVLTV